MKVGYLKHFEAVGSPREDPPNPRRPLSKEGMFAPAEGLLFSAMRQESAAHLSGERAFPSGRTQGGVLNAILFK